MRDNPKEPNFDGFDEEDLIRSEFDSIVSALSLDESSPSTYLDELDRIDQSQGFVPPNPPTQTPRSFFLSAQSAIARWFKRGYHEDDGAAI